MSGVNGGIDYQIDLSALPPSLAARIAYIQSGPDSPTELIRAAEEIAAASSAHPETLPVLVDMLGFNNPVAANVAVSALAAARAPAVPALLRGVAAFNYAVNAYALRALARIGDPAVADVALACAARGPIPNVRRAACRALAALRYERAPDAARAFALLLRLADAEPDWGVRYAAIAALEQFARPDLLAPELAAAAVEVVGAAGSGRARVRFAAVEEADGPEPAELPDVPSDPTVAARAVVALEVLERRVEAVAKV